MKEPAMQFRHAPVRNQDHVQLCDTRKAAALLSRNLKARRERADREFLQRRERDTHGPLPVVQGDPERRPSRLTCFLHFTQAPVLRLLHPIVVNSSSGAFHKALAGVA